MPKREDERWANLREGLRYCPTHKHWYRAGTVCPLCAREASKQLLRCPHCGEVSLFWNSRTNQYECLNMECSGGAVSTSETAKQLLRCPHCGDVSLFWNPRTSEYECLNRECIRGRISEDLGQGVHWDAAAGGYGRYRKDKYSEFKPTYEPPTRRPTRPLPAGVASRDGIRKLARLAIVTTVALAVVVALGLSGFFDSYPETTPPPEQDSPLLPTPPDDEPSAPATDRQPPYAKTWGSPVQLLNQDHAANPTWSQLKTFLTNDKTDLKSYSLLAFPCGAFAEELHNNAEAVGIRAAWVAISFADGSDGHALNAFQTTDNGLVFVDCTGRNPLMELRLQVISYGPGGEPVYGVAGPDSWDKIAYVAEGKEVGLIGLEMAASPEYEFYETYMLRIEEYDRRVETYVDNAEAYAKALGGRTSLMEPEYSRFMEWYNQLRQEEGNLEVLLEELGDARWWPLGRVSKVEVYW